MQSGKVPQLGMPTAMTTLTALSRVVSIVTPEEIGEEDAARLKTI